MPKKRQLVWPPKQLRRPKKRRPDKRLKNWLLKRTVKMKPKKMNKSKRTRMMSQLRMILKKIIKMSLNPLKLMMLPRKIPELQLLLIKLLQQSPKILLNKSVVPLNKLINVKRSLIAEEVVKTPRRCTGLEIKPKKGTVKMPMLTMLKKMLKPRLPML